MGRRLGLAPPAAALPDRLDMPFNVVVDTVGRGRSPSGPTDVPMAGGPPGRRRIGGAVLFDGRRLDRRQRGDAPCIWYLRWRRIARLVRTAAPLENAACSARCGGSKRAEVAAVLRGADRRDNAGTRSVRHPAARFCSGRAASPIGLTTITRGDPRARDLSRRAPRQPAGGAARCRADGLLVPPARVVDRREASPSSANEPATKASSRLGSEPARYAESILKTCRHSLEAPALCMAGVTGADLEQAHGAHHERPAGLLDQLVEENHRRRRWGGRGRRTVDGRRVAGTAAAGGGAGKRLAIARRSRSRR